MGQTTKNSSGIKNEQNAWFLLRLKYMKRLRLNISEHGSLKKEKETVGMESNINTSGIKFPRGSTTS